MGLTEVEDPDHLMILLVFTSATVSQTIESLPDQCTELKCKWSADGNPTVQLVPIDGCSCTTVRALPTQQEAEDLQLPLHAHTRQTKSQCLYNGQLKWGGAVLDRIDENCVKLVCKGVSGAQNYIETQVTAGCSCTQTSEFGLLLLRPRSARFRSHHLRPFSSAVNAPFLSISKTHSMHTT